LFAGGASGIPWYAYAAGAALLIAFGKTVAGIATETIKSMEEEEAIDAAAKAASSTGAGSSGNGTATAIVTPKGAGEF
jgi:hypothetical protein